MVVLPPLVRFCRPLDSLRLLEAALETLAPKKRIVLYLHEIEGLDLKEIAYLVDSNPVTVRTRLFYARREFYRAIAGDTALDPNDKAAASEEGDE